MSKGDLCGRRGAAGSAAGLPPWGVRALCAGLALARCELRPGLTSTHAAAPGLPRWRNSLSGGPDSRIFPWNMENGIPINCDWYKSIQSCAEGERHDLWQVPLWPLNGYTMDYGE